MNTLTSKTNYGRKVPDFCGRLYTDDQPNGAAGTWVRRAEVDALLDEIAMLRRRLETRELNDVVQKHCSDETGEQPPPNRNHDKDCPCYECANLRMCRVCGRTGDVHHDGCSQKANSVAGEKP